MFLRLKRFLGIAPHYQKTPAELKARSLEIAAEKRALAEELARPFNELLERRAARKAQAAETDQGS
ncbi:MAG TPA: hypothetical protein VK181_02645 [Rhizobium sp.]|nr:hypothetical protein [Rhizobium sp.]